MQEIIQTEVAVIGSGPGGYVAAIRAAKLGKKVVCIEEKSIGGVCLNIGCIPSKALIQASKNYSKFPSLEKMGIFSSVKKLDGKQLQSWKQSVVDKLTQGISSLFKTANVSFVQGKAEFITNTTLLVTMQKKEVVIEAKDIIIATGSIPASLPGFEVDNTHILDSTGALSLEVPPKRLLVIGGGYIGLELGSMWARLGSKVTVVEYGEQLLPGIDLDLVKILEKKLKEQQIEIYTNYKALNYKKKSASIEVVVQERQTLAEKTIETDYVLCSVGRKPNTQNLNLEKIGIHINEQGFIPVNLKQQTAISNIYAIGDVCGQPMLAHKASKEAEIAAETIAGHFAIMEPVGIPAVVFTDPEIATVGLTEKQAQQKGLQILVGKYPFSILGRALASMELDGFVKVIADAKNKRLVGIHIVGPSATDLISEATLALEMGATLEDLAWTIHPHPTLGEALMEAAKVALKESPHLLS